MKTNREGNGAVAETESVASPTPAGAIASASTKQYTASIHPGSSETIPREFAELILQLETYLEVPIWLMVHGDGPKWLQINHRMYCAFQKALEGERTGAQALLIDSGGGGVDAAYRIARLFQRHGSLTTMVPRIAKSAATLIALGGREIVLGPDAELGPLDVQLFDEEREDFGSALNSVQSLERLSAAALTIIDQTMIALIGRTGKKMAVVLPHVLSYAVSFVAPLVDKLDTVDYTSKSRDLKLAEDYAVRLMRGNYTPARAKEIASRLVGEYPAHGFVIDKEEAETPAGSNNDFGLGLKVAKSGEETETILRKLVPLLEGLTAIGRVKEVQE